MNGYSFLHSLIEAMDAGKEVMLSFHESSITVSITKDRRERVVTISRVKYVQGEYFPKSLFELQAELEQAIRHLTYGVDHNFL